MENGPAILRCFLWQKAREQYLSSSPITANAGLVLPIDALQAQQKLPSGLGRILSDIKGAEWVELGWGDEAFYRAGTMDQITTPMVLEALFTPTPSVVHAVGFVGYPPSVFSGSKLVGVALSESGLTNLLVGIENTLNIPSSYEPPSGLYGDSRFYPANGQYQIFNICNHWVAERLADAGLPINVTLASWPGLLRTDLSYRAATSSGD